MDNTYYVVKQAGDPDKEFCINRWISEDSCIGEYVYERGSKMESKEVAWKIALREMGVVVEVREEIKGGWVFQDEEGKRHNNIHSWDTDILTSS